MTDIHDLVAQLNVMLQADPIAITALFEYRVACSRALANTSCVVGTIDHDDYFVTGVLGVLNGLVGGDLRIASEWDGPLLAPIHRRTGLHERGDLVISAGQKALLHIAKMQLHLERDEYEAILLGQAGVTSSNDLDNAGFDAVMERFGELGFKNTSVKKQEWNARRRQHHPDDLITPAQQLLIRDLYTQLGWYDLARQKAFSQRQTRKPYPQTRRDANKVIEGLKAILKRAVAE